ncbi:hypothetical protein C8T65DRAFT_746165 [Cerioporus squamosus]|nr:hypothetical protein C8T65DRAFT_746165 [Cerioporus squamosus]
MSSATPDPAFVAQYSSFLLSNYCAIAASAVFIYEYLITLGDEVNLFWSRRLTGATLLFVSNRALVMWAHIFTMVTSYIPISPAHNSAFSTLRAFALTRLWSLSIFVLLLSSVPIGINFTNFGFTPGGVVVPPLGCVYSDSLPADLANSRTCNAILWCLEVVSNSLSFTLPEVTIASRTCLISADLLLVVTTWWKLSRGSTQHRQKGSFVYVLLRDGTIYFIALLVLNALHLTLTLLSHTQALQSVSVVTLFTEPLTGILVSRFLLNLQSANQQVLHVDSSLASDTGGTSESLVFERVIGSLGSRTLAEHEDEEDDTGEAAIMDASANGAEFSPSDAHQGVEEKMEH